MTEIEYVTVDDLEVPEALYDNMVNGVKATKRDFNHEFLLAEFSVIDNDTFRKNHHELLMVPRKGILQHLINGEVEEEEEYDRTDLEDEEILARLFEFVLDVVDDHITIEEVFD